MACSRLLRSSASQLRSLLISDRGKIMAKWHLISRLQSLNTQASLNLSSSFSTDSNRPEEQHLQAKGSDFSSNKGTVLHKRQVPAKTIAETAQWREFSKTLSKEDSFGTYSTQSMTARQGSSTKRRNRKKKSARSVHDVSEGWTDEFGTMAQDDPDYKEIQMEETRFAADEGEDDSFEQPHRRLSATDRRHTQNWYGKQIERLAAQGKIFEAVRVLEVTMLREDRVTPNQYVFTVLIGALGRVGYTKKAFSLYNKMKKFGLAPEDPTYTALFNACSNSPWREDGLQRATKLWEQMQEQNIQPNLTTYKAMVKAFGRCGDLQMAFSLVDELNMAKYRADEEVFAMLLQACLTDKSAGLRYAIEVWRRLNKRRKVSPTIYHYNLLMRIIRDCHIGEPVLANQLLQGKSHDNTELTNQQLPSQTHMEIHPVQTLESKQGNTFVEDISQDTSGAKAVHASDQNDLVSADSKSSWWTYKTDNMASLMESVKDASSAPQCISILDADVPNILYKNSQHSGQILGLGNLDTKENRLALFGGLPGVLKNMEADEVVPDIKTFTQLLDLIPSNQESERDLLALMNTYNVEKDVGLCNMLIRRRNVRGDYTGAKDVLSLMAKNNLSPDVITYGCLAMGCKKKYEGMELLKSIESADIMPTVYICDILMQQTRLNFSYKLALCQNMKRLDIMPNESFLIKCENSIETARKLIVLKEKGKSVPPYVNNVQFDKDFADFMKYYKPWLISINLDQEPHPWEQFRKDTPDADSDRHVVTVK